MKDRRNGMGPVPSNPSLFVNRQQVWSLVILKKFGWKLVCIRRNSEYDQHPAMVLRNCKEASVGVLKTDGLLRLTNDLRLRKLSSDELQKMDFATVSLLKKFDFAKARQASGHSVE
jgi:hypothetical protein